MKQVDPKNNNVLVEIMRLKEVVEDVFVGNQNSVETDAQPTEFYVGKAHKFGPTANIKGQCPELKENDLVIFSNWSGIAATTTDAYSKVIPGANIVAITKSLEMKLEDLKPTGARVLVEVIEDSKVDENGVFNDKAEDPREVDTMKGKVISLGAEAMKLEIGETVYFNSFVGNLIVNRPTQKIKTINSTDILFTA